MYGTFKMFCIKGIKGISKLEFGKIICLITDSTHINVNSSNVHDILEVNDEIYQDICTNDYIIYEATDKQITSFVGISANTDETIINHIHINDMCGIYEMDEIKFESCQKTASKLINMIKVVAKTEIMTVVNTFDDAMIQLLQNLNFEYVEFEDDDKIWMVYRPT
jgi:hypothetical protein